jgi:aldehyde:ferredoxin oxidoreductase
MPGYFGASLKGVGVDQCVIQGKANRPIYLWIDNGEVRFEEADHLWGKETTETTITIQEEKEDRNIEVLCIGPAGERQISFANVIHRLSWTGDYLGLGYLFGVKQLKAIAIRGKKPITLHDPKQFLDLCLTLEDQIQKDRKVQKLKKGVKLSFLSPEGERMIKEGTGWLPAGLAKQWSTFLRTNVSSREGCFTCPVNCGRNIQHQESYFRGIHLEKAWYLGPQIGVYNGEWTLKLHHLCQSQGFDPYLTSSLLSRIMKGSDDTLLPEEDLKQTAHIEDQGEKAFVILRRIIEGSRKEFHLPARPASENKHLDTLADIISFCPIVVKHLTQRTVSNMINLIYSATGYFLSKEDLRDMVRNIVRVESRLQNMGLDANNLSPLPLPGESKTNEI